MSDPDELNHEQCRQAMVMIIAGYASFCVEEIGKDRLTDRVMEAMARVPRHEFVPVELQEWAYDDMPLPIGCGKTISQPFMVALMTDLLAIGEHDKVLEIGTGLGYQTAILARAGGAGFLGRNHRGAGERGGTPAACHGLRQCAASDRRRLSGLGGACAVRQDHRNRGAELVPQRLLEQLKPGGKMVLPVGVEDKQKLVVVEKGVDHQVRTRELIAVRFSPLITSH